jgi:TonB-dependent receptor
LFLFCAKGVVAQSTRGATIVGEVSNAATQSYLQGAEVRVDGMDEIAYTDREGRYSISVPAGRDVTLVVGYSGLDMQRVAVTPRAGEVVRQDFALTAAVYKLEKFTVAGDREGTARAETLQRQAGNVKNVVSSDTFGNVADGNVGELLQHVVGITADYNGPDVRQVSVRGVSADLNSVTMDGVKVATAQSAGFGRAFEFEQASLGNIETIEVTKAATPDMDADSIGGSVNLVTKSAFDSKAGRRFNYSIGAVTGPNRISHGASWKMPIDGYGPSINLRYADVLGAKQNIGITLTGTMFSKPGGGANSLMAHARNVDPGPVYTQQVQRRVSGATRTRLASGAKIDYKWSEATTLSFSTSYNFFHENNDTRTANLAYTLPAAANTNPVAGLAILDASGNRTGGGFIRPNFTDRLTEVLPGGTATANVMTVSTNDKSGRTFLFHPSARHRFPGLDIDYGASLSRSSNWYDVSHKNEKYPSRPKGDVVARLNNIGWVVDRTKDLEWPTIRQTSGPDMYDLNNYTGLTLTQTDRVGHDTVLTGKFNVRKVLPVTLPAYLKAGLSYQRQERKTERNTYAYTYTGPDGIVGTADDAVGVGQFFQPTDYHDSDEERYASRGGVPPWPNPYSVARHQSVHPELWSLNLTSNTQAWYQFNREITETVGAAYLMGNAKLGPVGVLGGVRMEETRNEGEGPLQYVSPAERARRAAWVGPVTAEETRRRVTAEWGNRATAEGKYRNYFPSVHLKYEPFQGMVARASWSNGIGRPAFDSIIPNNNVNDDTQRVTASNPDLKPQYSNNYDLSLEYYFRSQGMVSFGAFRKKIEDYIETDSSQLVPGGPDNGFDGQYEGYTLVTQRNSGFAEIKGLEFSYQQQLSFLPGWARGFGVQANFTKLNTKGPNRELSGFLDRTANGGLSFRGFGFDLRLLANWRSKYKTSNSTNPALEQYQKSRVFVNWKSRYSLSRRLSLFFDVENIFSEPLDNIYAAYPDRVVSLRTFDAKIVFGIEGRL